MACEPELLSNWTEFRTWIKSSRNGSFCWRGQKNSNWPLASSFERLILGMHGGSLPEAAQIYPYGDRYRRNGETIWEPDFFKDTRDAYLKKFKNAASGLRGLHPQPLSDDQLWALGRHYDLVTPLLDWTDSPYIAAFFAMSEWITLMIDLTGQTVAVYRLNIKELEEEKKRPDVWRFKIEEKERPENEQQGAELRLMRPEVEELGRMHEQRRNSSSWKVFLRTRHIRIG